MGRSYCAPHSRLTWELDLDQSGNMVCVSNTCRNTAIEGADFASTLLSIWIGHEPPNGDLKSGLLGGQCK